MSQKPNGALRILLSQIIDYAGLFPPAELSMVRAVQNYADYLASEHAWMLGRFVVSADRLEEFISAAQPFWRRNNLPAWRISVLAKNDLNNPVALQVEEFNRTYKDFAVIDALEVRANDAAEIRAAKQFLPNSLSVYFELPLASTLPGQISALAVNKYRAKIRTGGIVPDAFPPVDELVKFLRVCLAANVPFKATAGLHHPLRTVKPLTYDKNAPTGTMHGFLNLFLSTAFMRQSLNNPFVHKLMADGDASNFQFDADGAQWSGNRINLQHLQLTRTRNAVSFGSCSFTEPIEDLQQLGFL